jgi:hypothetical protein
MKHTQDIIERLNAKTNKTETCWLWQGAISNFGYGNFSVHGKTVGPHRVAWEIVNGDIPPGLFIDHLCHTKHCVRPTHLRLATRKENGENRKSANTRTTSGILGVSWSSSRQQWKGTVVHNGTHYHTGWFNDKGQAGESVTAKRLELYTHNDLDRAA